MACHVGANYSCLMLTDRSPLPCRARTSHVRVGGRRTGVRLLIEHVLDLASGTMKLSFPNLRYPYRYTPWTSSDGSVVQHR